MEACGGMRAAEHETRQAWTEGQMHAFEAREGFEAGIADLRDELNHE
jgi:hypothetical protein